MLTVLITYCGVGVIAGFLAGLFGIGGGLVIVPMLVYVMGTQGVSPEVFMHLALGTSMASIMFTSVSSFMAHHRRGAVQWEVVRRIVIGIFTGTFLGSCIAAAMSTAFLKGFFCVFLYVVATQMLMNKKPKASRELPGAPGMFDGEFTHEGNKCTFEVMIERLKLQDKALSFMAQVIHDIDLKDGEYGRMETDGIKALLTGLTAARPDDHLRMKEGFAVFENLYAYFHSYKGRKAVPPEPVPERQPHDT